MFSQGARRSAEIYARLCKPRVWGLMPATTASSYSVTGGKKLYHANQSIRWVRGESFENALYPGANVTWSIWFDVGIRFRSRRNVLRADLRHNHVPNPNGLWKLMKINKQSPSSIPYPIVPLIEKRRVCESAWNLISLIGNSMNEREGEKKSTQGVFSFFFSVGARAWN